MLKLEDLKSNESLKDLPESALQVIVSLSEIEENKLIAAKTREIWDSVDADIEAVTGVKKPATTKSYNHLKDVLTGLNEKSSLGEKVKDYETKIQTLEEQLKKGTPDKGLLTKVTELETELQRKDVKLKELNSQLAGKSKEFEEIIRAKESEIMTTKWDTALNTYVRSLNFKKGIPQEAIDSMLEVAKREAMTLGEPEFKEVDGKLVIHYKDEDGLIMYDQKNRHVPLTAEQKIISKLSPILAEGKQTGGSGSDGGRQRSFIDLGGAKNKQEALSLIVETAKGEGLIPGTEAYVNRTTELATENSDVLAQLT